MLKGQTKVSAGAVNRTSGDAKLSDGGGYAATGCDSLGDFLTATAPLFMGYLRHNWPQKRN